MRLTWPAVTGRRRAAAWVVVAAAIAMSPPASVARDGEDTVPPGKTAASDPVITVEVPHPDLLVDRLTDPRIQQSLKLIPQYRKALEGPQFRQLTAVVQMISGQLHTTWDRGLRDLTGGGIVARVSVEPGHEPQVELLITPLDPKVLQQVNEIFLKMVRDDARNKKAPEPVRTSDYKGSVVHVVGGAKGLAYALVAGRLAAANSTAGLERIIDRLQSKTQVPSAARNDANVVLRGHVNLDRLRKLDPKKYALTARPDTGVVFLFGSWYEALEHARTIDATVRWSETQFTASVELPLPKDGRPPSVKGFVPDSKEGTAPPLHPPGTIASLSLWRDWATIWESRADLFSPEVVQGFAQLDTLAGQFFAAREFGADVLGAFDPHWRLVIAQQDYAAMRPAPDTKLPAFAIVAELNGSQDDFAARLRIAFQSFVALSNIDAAQKKAAVLELGSEEVEGIHMSTTKYVVPQKAPSASAPGATRYNFSPSTAQVGKYFVLSSSAELARSLVKELKSATVTGNDQKQEPATFSVVADGPELARLFEQNRSRMVMQTMLSRGETKEDAGHRVDLNLALLRYLGHGRLVVTDGADRTRLELKLELSR